MDAWTVADSVMDAFIAATARSHDLALVTRKVPDFAPSLQSLINPWSQT